MTQFSIHDIRIKSTYLLNLISKEGIFIHGKRNDGEFIYHDVTVGYNPNEISNRVIYLCFGGVYHLGKSKAGTLFMSVEEFFNDFTFYISEQDYFKLAIKHDFNYTTTEVSMKNLQKANYIAKCQFAQSPNNYGEKWTHRAVLGTLSNLYNDKFYNKTYNFAVPEGMSIKKGDYVLVTVSVNDCLSIVKVVEIVKDSLKNMEEINKATSMIIGKVNISSIIDQIIQAERAKYLKSKIDELKKTFEERKMLEIMAQNDPEAAKLIKEYTNLTKYLPKVEEK